MLLVLRPQDIMQSIPERRRVDTSAAAAAMISTVRMQAPSKVQAVQVLNISLRALHVSKQAPFARPLVSAFQKLLRETPMGTAFFASVAKPQAIKNILSQAYGDATAVDDELVDCLLKPGLEPGAVQVFLDFIRCARTLILSHSLFLE